MEDGYVKTSNYRRGRRFDSVAYTDLFQYTIVSDRGVFDFRDFSI